MFHHTVFHTRPGMEVFTISPERKMVTTFEGLRIETDFSLANAPAIDILVIPSAEHNMDSDLKDLTIKQWVHERAAHARFVLTLCDGAFILANTGSLNGYEATTFPADVAAFRKMFPEVTTREGVSFVHHDRFITSQGGAKSYEAALYLVALLYGDKVAAGVGRGLVLPWPDPSIQHRRVP